MSLRDAIRQHVGTAIAGAVLALLGTAAATGAISWADGRYLLFTTYTTDQMARGVLTVDMQIRQVDWRLRDAAQQLADAEVRGDSRAAAQARADQTFYGAEKDTLLRRRTDLMRSD